MFGRMQWRRRLCGVALVAAVEGFAALTFTAVVAAPAQAQDQYQFMRRQYQRQQREGGGFFGFFGGGWSHQPSRRHRSQSEPRRHVDNSRAPPPRKRENEPDPNKPITSVVVMGGSMADWLAYGLEDAFSDAPNIEIVRKGKDHSGLLRYQAKSDLDWWHVARDELAQQKANYVVMMLGITDRQNIRESDVAKEAEQDAAKNAEKNAPLQLNGAAAPNTGKANEAKDKPKPRPAKGVIEFRSDQWDKVYSRRIDKTIAALKSRGVPVFWVGLPSIRGTKSTADAVYLNNLYRARAQRAGVVYIDVWDGFVDDAGKYSSYGPDYEGQTRRLRSGDGVFFTKYGARKLAHYVEREIRRYMNNRVTTLTLPTGPFGPTPGGKSAVRPLAGPVLPLTANVGTTDVLLGGAGMRPARSDATASSVLVKGDAVSAPPGRADDFKWPPDSQDYGKPAPPPAASKPAKTGPAAAAPMTLTPAVAQPQTQASAPPAAVPPPQTPGAALPSATEKTAAAAAAAQAQAQAKAEAEAKKQAEEQAQAEARQRAAEKARAEARRSTDARTETRRGLRPPARIETQRRQVQRRQPRRRSNDPFGELFGLLPR